ncbi:MAG TPA: glycoside hydrolase family 5 protein [Rhizobacter sp.]|nr:glycoside hydrolase family 5 protein [Rhizobacter sp.]
MTREHFSLWFGVDAKRDSARAGLPARAHGWRHLLALSALAVLAVCTGNPAAAAPPLIKWRGVNLAGAEFSSSVLPGRPGWEYIYPSIDSVDYYKNKGMNLVRLPFLWERLQPALYGDFNAAELSYLKGFVNGATAKGMTVLIDPHNYARYRSQVIGSAAVPYSAFGDFWWRLALEFKFNRNVIFGLMNEPNEMPTETWVIAANEAIRNIRATGARQTIAVPGNGFTGAHSWASDWYGTPNAQALLRVHDSGNNMVIEAHQYLDTYSSGMSPECTSPTIGAERLVTFTNWLRTYGKRGLLGEFAGADNPTCHQALDGMLAYMEANSDVWAGWTYWAGGPWWGDSPFNLEPSNGVDRPQMATIQPYLD